MDTTDIALEAAFQAAGFADYRQTTQVVKNPDLYYETNAVLGKHPSQGAVDRYFMIGAVVHFSTTLLLPEGPWRTGWQAVMLGIEVNTVAANLRVGLRF